MFVIDELDRCRPSFALELLEKIKHFFAVRGVTFVLVSSLTQLETAVRFAYGDLDARSYLEKFYHLRILFPTGNMDRRDMASGTYLRHLQREYSVANSGMSQIIDRFSRLRSLSLRTLERIFAYVNLAELSIPPKHFKNPTIISVLCIIKVIDPGLYEFCRTGSVNFSQVESLMRFRLWQDEHNPQQGDQVSEVTENWWRYALGALDNAKRASEFAQSLAAFGHVPPSQIVPHFCEIIDGFSLPNAVSD